MTPPRKELAHAVFKCLECKQHAQAGASHIHVGKWEIFEEKRQFEPTGLLGAGFDPVRGNPAVQGGDG